MASTVDHPAHWSKEFVKHIRAVHFSLATVAVALIILGVPPDEQASRAITQASQIASLSANWAKLRADLLQQAFSKLIGSPISNPTSDFKTIVMTIDAVPPNSAEVAGHAQLQMHVDLNAPGEVSETDSGLHVGASLQRAPENLAQFENWWYDLRRMGLQYLFPDQRPDRSGHSLNRCSAWVNLPDEEERSLPGEPFRFVGFKCTVVQAQPSFLVRDIFGKARYSQPDIEHAPEVRFAGSADEVDGLTFGGTRRLARIYVEVPVSFRPVTLRQDALSSYFGAVTGDFNHAFPDLAVISRTRDYINYIPLSDLVARIAEMVPKTEQDIEVFGLKIPIVDLVTWGTLVLFVVQFYLWLHLHEFGRRRTPSLASLDGAWIGIYSSRMALAAAVSSACVLPICAVVVLTSRYLDSFRVVAGLRHWPLRPVVGMLAGVLLVQFALSAAICRGLVELRRLNGPQPLDPTPSETA
jgi:hypothetical protein